MSKQGSFFEFDLHHRKEQLSKFGDPLEKLSRIVDFEVFRPTANRVIKRDKIVEGRPSFDVILMIKILILSSLYNLSDEQMEYQIKDRLSFMRFLNLTLQCRIPDAKTIWLYREKFRKENIINEIFDDFVRLLEGMGYVAKAGQIMDATIIECPKQRNTRSENETIKENKIPDGWAINANKMAQKDCDARWFVKFKRKKEESNSVDLATLYFGYKNHIGIDNRYKFIRKFCVTPANVYDGDYCTDLLSQNNDSKDVFGDKHYGSEKNLNLVKCLGFEAKMHSAKKRSPNTYASVRARVEHVFAYQKNSMKLTLIRTIGLARAATKIALANLAYNMQRLVSIKSRTLAI